MKITAERFYELSVKTTPILGAGVAAAASLHPNPVYNAIWSGASFALTMMGTAEREVFAEELNKEKLSTEILNSVEFIKAAKVALETAANTTSQDKVKKAAQLLRNGSVAGIINDFDIFKEYARLIDDISPREFRILAIMDHEMEGAGMFGKLSMPVTRGEEQEVGHLRKAENERIITTASFNDIPQEKMSNLEYKWRGALRRIREELDASVEAVDAYMLRLTRTGCITPVTLPIRLDTEVRTMYRLTPLYASLVIYIEQQASLSFTVIEPPPPSP